MPTVEFKGKTFEVDEDGFLQGGLDDPFFTFAIIGNCGHDASKPAEMR